MLNWCKLHCAKGKEPFRAVLHLSRAEISYFIHFNDLILENFEEKSEVIFDQLKCE